jgi:ATP-dependent RNA helicase RhlE
MTPNKRPLLENLLQDPALARVIVFTRTKHRANRVAEQLEKAGISADAIHGNKSQNARQKALEAFRKGKARVLVATDIAARGIDVSGVTHVINYELPNEPESYVHRIGRTARAGAEGAAISFCDSSERAYLRDIERLIKQRMEVIGDAPANDDFARGRPARKQGSRNQGPRNQGPRKQGQGGRPGRKPAGAKSEGQSQGENKNAKKRSYKGLASGGAAKKNGEANGNADSKGGQRPFKGRRRGKPGNGGGQGRSRAA